MLLRHAGLALSIGLASCLNAGLLFRGLHRLRVYRPSPGWGGYLARLGVALAALALALHYGAGSDALWTQAPALERVLRLAAIVVGGGVVYFSVLFMLGFRPADFRRRAA